MSQLSSQAQEPTWLSIPFAKFSHDTSPYGTRKIPWIHVAARDDLDFIVRNIRTVDEQHGNYSNRTIMKITAGAELLESQDLGEIVKFTQDHNPLSGAEQPVQIVVRCPVMAMRYPKTINTVRRIQLKFRNEVDFTKAFNVLRDLGLPISDSGGSIITQPSPSPAPSLLSSTSVCSTSSAATSISRSSSEIPASCATTDSTSFLGRHYSFHNGFKTPLHPENLKSEAQRPLSALSYLTPQITVPTSKSAAPELRLASMNKIDSFDDTVRQETSLYLSQLERESQIRRLSQPFLPRPSHNGDVLVDPTKPLYLSQVQSQLALLPKIMEAAKESPTGLSSASPFFESTLQSDNLGQRDFVRPSSTPAIQSNDIYDSWIPPRRELPFPKTRNSSNAQPSSASDLPPLAKKSPVARNLSPSSKPAPTRTRLTIKFTNPTEEATTTPASKPAPKKRIAQRKASTIPEVQKQKDDLSVTVIAAPNLRTDPNVAASPEDAPSPLAAKSAAAARPSSTSGLPSKATADKKRTAAPVRPPLVTKRPKMTDHSTQTQTLSGRDHTTGTKSVSRNIDTDSVDKPVSSTQPDDQPESYLTLLDTFITKHKSRYAPKELWETAGYADSDEEQRLIILNDFICENLENRDFLQLCQDTEKAWRRVGLGM